jgi:hypothetical protein
MKTVSFSRMTLFHGVTYSVKVHYIAAVIIPFMIILVNMNALQIHEVCHSSGIILLFLLKY